MHMHVHVDVDSCTGSGSCEVIAPAVFHIRLGVAEVHLAHVEQVGEELLWEAARSCPWDAIILTDDEGQRLYP